MRTAIVSVIVLSCLATASLAVEVGGYGVKGGLATSRMRNNSMASHKYSEWSTDFAGGPFVNVALSKSVVLQPAVIYVRRGGTYNEYPERLWGGAALCQLEISRDYLELPLLIRWNVAPASQFSPALVIGLVWGWVVASEVLEDGVAYPDHAGESDWAMSVGLGLTKVCSGRRISLDVSYRRAMTGVSGDAPGSFFNADGIDLTMGFEF